ncbi:class I SAM-dependent methyltransferase [Magnetospirillum sp. SS-4]|uniref:class I SAM-dependent methyltransferase n=1 Tax=Magnetospirillum sp. SS-4 TaxID=2681465 RepID=UPI00137F26EB|nr:methyltransferase domain-containing protein [Magnetospirillum sp. SS-4]CAA7617090.1 Methyltransferase type 11 [Magnetospirillum sp. SS-4]
MSASSIGPTRYAAWRKTSLGRIVERLEHQALLGIAPPLRGLNVLDIGCGDGVLAAEMATEGARVTGIDADPAMIMAARATVTEGQFLAGDACRLPFSDASFDLAVMNTVLCLIHDRRAALAEAARVLRGGGHLLIGELGRWSPWAVIRLMRVWLGTRLWRQAHFSDARLLAAEMASIGLAVEAMRGAVFFPPWRWAARLMAPFDPALGARTTVGAAYIAMTAQKI